MNFEEWYKHYYHAKTINMRSDGKLNDAEQGWLACKREVLKILKKDWKGCDLSINSCDEYYIKKIEEL